MAGHPELFPVSSVFNPGGHELINQYLRRRITEEQYCGQFSNFTHDADVYSVLPGDLIENRAHAPGSDKKDGKGGEWYFFSPAVTRTKSGRRRQQRRRWRGYNFFSEKIKPVHSR
ncbi:hypothetical protein ZWY2020_015004 [Hordeum vulgare]|nr:hypothetical protein ZWY2020_015004 [Hordeum vulgare]